MNSALQCVRSVEELTKYFLTDEYAEEINTDNPLAYDGKMAMAYGHLLKDMYNTSNGAVRPASFKGVAGQCRATFASWGQQDSQEFLGFLLDALQEDLSRVKRKPYIEKPDSTDEMIGDSAAIAKMAEDVWEITKRRDDSVIADLFTGLYKSTLKCPTCHKISITFDPFNNLTLPLPVENLWSRTVRFYPLNDAPVAIEVDIPRHSAIETLKQFLSDRTGVPVERLMGAEEFKGKFFKIYDDSMDVSEEIGNNDIASFYEVDRPYTNWPLRHVTGKRSRKTKGASPDSDDESWDDPRCDQMVVTVLHRRVSPRYSRGGYGNDDPVVPPHFIVLSREEVSF
jgi:ubiquitin carboxyl-terminal hydrolase 4/11/15